jgi:hypothetical protein
MRTWNVTLCPSRRPYGQRTGKRFAVSEDPGSRRYSFRRETCLAELECVSEDTRLYDRGIEDVIMAKTRADLS